jgi:hypothetical protein
MGSSNQNGSVLGKRLNGESIINELPSSSSDAQPNCEVSKQVALEEEEKSDLDWSGEEVLCSPETKRENKKKFKLLNVGHQLSKQ